jgi:DNA-binding transcriptional MerR regulator
MKIGFTPRQVTRLTGVPYSTLNLWAKNELISPSIEEGSGSGNERVYSLTDLFALKVAFALRKEGVSTRSLKNVILFIRKNEGLGHSLVEARLIVRGRDVVAVTSDKEMVSVLSNPGQAYLSFVLDLSRTLGELAEVAEQAVSFVHGLADSSDHQKKPPAGTGGKPQRRRTVTQTG